MQENQHSAAALLLVAAVLDLFPGTLLVKGQGTVSRFFYDFVFPFPFQEPLLVLIEERMRVLAKEGLVLDQKEMVPENAAALLVHQGQPLVAKWAAAQECALLGMCSMRGSVVPLWIDERLDIQKIPCFRLLEAIPLQVEGREGIRLVGAVAEDKQQMKQLVKQGRIASCLHAATAPRGDLLISLQENSVWFWTSKGIAIREQLAQYWKEACSRNHFSLTSQCQGAEGEVAQALLYKEYFEKTGQRQGATLGWLLQGERSEGQEGFLSTATAFSDRAYTLCSDSSFLEECISSLHFILQIPKILGFEFKLVLLLSFETPKAVRSKERELWIQAVQSLGVKVDEERKAFLPFTSCIEVQIQDVLGRYWSAPFTAVFGPSQGKKQDQKLLVSSLFGSCERFLALLLEREEWAVWKDKWDRANRGVEL